jgi:hypothetical protein
LENNHDGLIAIAHRSLRDVAGWSMVVCRRRQSEQRAPDAPARLETPVVRFVFAQGASPGEMYKDTEARP